MALTCGTLTVGIAADCLNLPKSGTTDALYLANFDDIDKAASVVNANGSITTIAMVATKTFFKIEGDRGSLQTSITQDNEGLVSTFRPTVTFRPFKLDQAEINEIEAMSRGKLVVVYEPLGQSATRPFIVQGWENGVRGENLEWSQTDQATGGMPLVTLTTPEEVTGETKVARVLLDTDYATTKTAFAAIVSGGY